MSNICEYLAAKVDGLEDDDATPISVEKIGNVIAEITRLHARLAAWKAEAEAWRQADDCDPMVRGECIREARERRAATDAVEKNAS